MHTFQNTVTIETIFNRLEQHGKTWKVYVAEPPPPGTCPTSPTSSHAWCRDTGTTTRPSRVSWATAS